MQRTVVFLGLAGLCLAAPVRAAEDPNAAKPIVVEHCVRCHEVTGIDLGGAATTQSAPPFQALADQPDVYTPERLRAFLRQPHYPMGQFILSESDIERLVTFIRSLRQ